VNSELESSLIAAIQKFFDENLSPSEESGAGSGAAKKTSEAKRVRVTDRQLQLATAVLLLEVARSDFDLCADEFQTLAKGVQRVLGLTEDEAMVAVRFAENEVKHSKRIHQFTTLIDENYGPEQKKRVVRNLWQVAFADAELRAAEEYLIRKISDLLHVPRADFLAAKIEARDAFR
jgi:uncharacterized tellurite resistance protein B-like protein